MQRSAAPHRTAQHMKCRSIAQTGSTLATVPVVRHYYYYQWPNRSRSASADAVLFAQVPLNSVDDGRRVRPAHRVLVLVTHPANRLQNIGRAERNTE